jgi:hypothetical protein
MGIFGWYRIAVAIIAACLVGFGILTERRPESTEVPSLSEID